MTSTTDLRLPVTVVVPTLGRPSLNGLLESLAVSVGPLPRQIIVVDDRVRPGAFPEPPERIAGLLEVRRSNGRGPAAARNVGWRCSSPESGWIAFLDDDVEVGRDWLARLADDLLQPSDVAGVQGRIEVPLPSHRRPTDWERLTAGLATASWITADMAYRRWALLAVGGFDERFPRAFREDADLALRVQATGARLVRGTRKSTHPVRPASRWVSVRQQAGNADDVLMRRVHGPAWRSRAGAPKGRRTRHLLTTGAAVTALTAALLRRRALAWASTAGWLIGTVELAWARVRPGPRTAGEVTTMLLTSAAIPPAATAHWLRGLWRHRSATAMPMPGHAALTMPMPGPPVRAVLFDRDGTLVHDVPYNGDPHAVVPVDGAIEAVRTVRGRGIRTGVLTNQSGVARGLLTREDVRRVNARVDETFGAFDLWLVCPHGPDDGCGCRKPAPGLVLEAAKRLGVSPHEIVVVGDIGADVGAAAAAGARGVLVPTAATLAEEIAAAPLVARDLAEAVRLTVGGPA